jgi:putative endonuclease
MTFTTYVLRDTNGKLYKGCTNDIVRRLREHRVGKTRTTKYMLDVQVVYKEEYSSIEEARSRELYLKSAAGRRFLQKILGP